MHPITRVAARIGLPAFFLAGLAITAPFARATSSTNSAIPVIARITAPPPPIDGTLTRFKTVPGWLLLNKPAQVVYGRGAWKGVADLSGRTVLGWDATYLYVAAQVTDDVVENPYFGSGLWHGDYVSLTFDVPRQPAGARDMQKLQHIGISPGNFAAGGHAELYRWEPDPGPISGAIVASARTPNGYQVAAAIPWTALGIKNPTEGTLIGVDVDFSDADEAKPEQESFMSLLTSRWKERDPNRLITMALGRADGTVDPSDVQLSFTPLGGKVTVQPGQSRRITIQPGEAKDVKELVVNARLNTPTVSGGADVMRIDVNGHKLGLKRVRNRLDQLMLGVHSQPTLTQAGWFVIAAPNTKPVDPTSPYSVRGINPFQWRFDVAGLWKPGQVNTITIHHTAANTPHDLIVQLGARRVLTPKLMPPTYKPAPTGSIPTFVPQGPNAPKVNYHDSLLPGGAIRVSLGDKQWTLTSAYSTVATGWARLNATPDKDQWSSYSISGDTLTAATDAFRLQRTIERDDDHLTVTDRLTNISDHDVPVMVHHQLGVGQGAKQIYVAGLPVTNPQYYAAQGPRPTALAIYDHHAIGVVSDDDLLRAQGRTFFDDHRIGIQDNHLVVAKGKSVTLQFSIYPMEAPAAAADHAATSAQSDATTATSHDLYFTFVNRIRRAWGTNFKIPGGFSFLYPSNLTPHTSDEQLKQCLANKALGYIQSTAAYYHKRGYRVQAQGSAILHVDQKKIDTIKNLVARLHRLRPKMKVLGYYNQFDSAYPPDAKTYADAATLRPDGSQAHYADPHILLYVPREGTPYAKLQDRLIDFRYNTFGADGIYCDEMSDSRAKWDYSDHWDGVSAEISPKTHRIVRKIASVTLASQSWRVKWVTRVLARGPLIANSEPVTRTMTNIHFPRFVETGSQTNLVLTQLYSPISLGDHHTEYNVIDCYKHMLSALDYGALYYWYSGRVFPAYPTLTSHMFPSTPMRLGHGFVIAKERILTDRSGDFGWDDDSGFIAYVYDRDGKQTDAVPYVKKIQRDGKTFAEVRLPEGFSAAVVRKLP